MVIDESNRAPKYVQIHNWLHGMIKRGKFRLGEKLPTEEELAKSFGVNRMTVRQAIDEFVVQKMVVRKRGKGTFLINDKPKDFIYELQHISSFTDDMKRIGLNPTTKTVKVEVKEAERSVGELLDLKAERQVIHTLRVKYADREPVLIERSYLPHHEFKEILKMDLSGSLYHLLVEHFNINLHHSTQVFSAVVAKPEDRELFQVRRPIPCIQLESVIYDPDNIPIEVLFSLYRGDKYRFKVSSGEYLFDK